MTVKLVTLRSGEDLICDIKEVYDDEKLCAYSLNVPYSVKLLNPETLLQNMEKISEPRVTFFPWQPLSSDANILIPIDWVVCITEPIIQIKNSYIDKTEFYKRLTDEGCDSKDSGNDERSDSDQSD